MASRTYRLDSYFGKGLQVTIATDASPWGIGGNLTVSNSVVACFADALEDEELLQMKLGMSASRQAAEALAILVALKLWAGYWKRPGISLRIRGDNVGVLALLMKMRPTYKSWGQTMIARELALEFGCSSYKPRIFQRIPGVANDWADALSRFHQPDKKVNVPTGLTPARRDKPPARTKTYYATFSTASQSSMM